MRRIEALHKPQSSTIQACNAGRLAAFKFEVGQRRSVAADLPGDWRPLNLAGAALLLGRQPEQALERYREALKLGERPEIDVNVGRAYASLGRDDHAMAAFLRAGWVSPAVLAWLPNATGEALRPALSALEQQLVEGRLSAPPALPPDLTSAGGP